MAKSPKRTPSIPLLVTALVVLVFSYLFLEKSRNGDNLYAFRSFQNATGKLPENAAFAKSNFEWLSIIGLTDREFIKSSIISTTLAGTVTATKEEKGKLPIKSDYYYVGEPGFYEYGRTLTLKTPSGTERTFYFSTKRTEAMKVMKGTATKKFEDIKPGDNVEVTETVDLAIPNINDANLVSLIVKIL